MKSGRYIFANKPKSFERAGFQPQQETAFIVHGFNGSHMDTHMRYLKDGMRFFLLLILQFIYFIY